MRAIRWCLLGLGGIVILNGLLWLLIGQERTLLLGSSIETFEVAQPPDTLILFTGPVERIKGYSQYSDYESATIHELADRIEEGKNLTVLIDERPFPLASSSGVGAELLIHNAMAYDVAAIRDIPFYSRVSRSLFAPGFVVVFESRNMWFFRWWQINDEMTAIS